MTRRLATIDAFLRRALLALVALGLVLASGVADARAASSSVAVSCCMKTHGARCCCKSGEPMACCRAKPTPPREDRSPEARSGSERLDPIAPAAVTAASLIECAAPLAAFVRARRAPEPARRLHLSLARFRE